MTEWNLGLPIIALAAILLCCIIVLFQRRNTKKIMKTLNQMLDSAIDGSFTEHSFDESLLSSVESRLNRYLTASAVSARNLTTEKEKIKELLADISHQTKTPIANILLYAQLLEEQAIPEESRDCIAALRGQAEKLSFLITALVKLSRLETGVLTLHPVSNTIAPMLDEVAAQFMPKAAQKEIRLTVDSTDADAVFDFKWTTEALCNLVDNAIKYTSSGGSIRIKVKVYDLFCRIDVADTGIGISEAEQAKIFARFYRSQSVCEQEGVGIGLYLTRQILAGQSGYIKVATSLGDGAVFSMFLPRKN
ncbi:sensor histidine kinase [Desulforamulus ruminis]|uniref:histidine kinase n=1 Tax=Desulforamulus ruminis (strain ATCC 23193 / DSM 2154 / NCIMB 8452 / DL) TaxID=696281 RepID=F6DR77_DESRL|nr:HAMP domain-containing sensor histidine kinase [Desulforamulus ruminis]AEG60912.1 ATP-binding region ATPase domain protein [Desulforamulus ruminis DSM 2154]